LSFDLFKYFVISNKNQNSSFLEIKLQMMSTIASSKLVKPEILFELMKYMISQMKNGDNFRVSEFYLILLSSLNDSISLDEIKDQIENIENLIQYSKENNLVYLCGHLKFHKKIKTKEEKLGNLFNKVEEFISQSLDDSSKFSQDLLIQFFVSYCFGFQNYADEKVFNLTNLFNLLFFISKNVKSTRLQEIQKNFLSLELDSTQNNNLLDFILKTIQFSCQRGDSSQQWKKLINHTTAALNLYDFAFQKRIVNERLVDECLKTFSKVVSTYASIDPNQLVNYQIQQVEYIIELTLKSTNFRASFVKYLY
jgi:hypothetical protein